MGRLWLIALASAATVMVSVSFIGQHHVADAASLPACSANYATQPTTVARRVRGEVVGLTSIGTWGTSACSLHDRLTFTVQNPSDRFSSRGVIRSIKGNPATKAVSASLKPGSVRVYAWRWRNWCGAPGHFILQAFWKELPFTTPSQLVKAPSCLDRASLSTLSETRSSLPSCSTADYRVTTGLGQPFEAHLIEFVNIALRKGHSPCLLSRVHVSLAVQGESGGKWTTLGQIQGNPGNRTVGTMLTQTYGGFGVFWAWSNWCGGEHHFRAVATVGGRSVAGPTSSQGATCEGTNAPSTLTPSYGHS